jgi:membrane-bound lytic murein transglycosylase D
MPETARQYGLAVSETRDERLDVVKSTRAAARYLRDLYGQFGEWQLAFAAYNAGGQTVSQAMTRARDRNFSRVQPWLPRETRSYVPAVLDAMALFGGAGAVTTQAGEISSKTARVYAQGW